MKSHVYTVPLKLNTVLVQNPVALPTPSHTEVISDIRLFIHCTFTNQYAIMESQMVIHSN